MLSLNVPYQCLNKIGHRACLGDVMGQTYPIYACTLALITRVTSSVHGTLCCSWKEGFFR